MIHHGSRASARKPTPRATRIPDDFTVTPEMVAWARVEVPHVDGRRETANFIDHWRSASGSNARKVDWSAAWRKWMRIADDRLPANVRSLPTPATQQGTSTQRANAFLDLRLGDQR